MKYYELHFQNPDFYIADASVNALIRVLKKVDPQIRFSRGKIENGHAIYFDSNEEDTNIFREKIQEFIKDKKYENHKFYLMAIEKSKIGISEMKNIKSFTEYEKIYEDTLLNYEAWDKPIIVGIDNDDQGGYITLSIDGKQVAKKYVALQNELEAWKKKASSGHLRESTSNYWPGYSDDGTADSLSDIRDKTSKIHNKELQDKETEVLKFKHVPSIETKEQRDFLQKWMYANMITTSLQDGFYIKPELLEKSLDLYKELSEIDTKKLFGEKGKGFPREKFDKTIPIIIEELGKKTKEGPIKEGPTYKSMGEYYYSPGFLDQKQEARKNKPELE